MPPNKKEKSKKTAVTIEEDKVGVEKLSHGNQEKLRDRKAKKCQIERDQGD